MPNWKKLIVSGSDASLNSLVVATNVNAQSFTGSLLGTASYAVNADLLDGQDSSVFATTGSNIFKGLQTIDNNLFMSGSNRLIYNDSTTNSMLFGFFDGSNIYGPYYQIFGNQYSNVTQRGSAEFVYDNRNGGGSGFNVVSFNGSTWTRIFRVADSGAQVTGSLEVTGGITGSLFGTSSYAVSASHALLADTASFITSSYVYGPYGANSILSASYAQTASYAKNITITGSITGLDYIDFDTNVAYTVAEGRLGWDSGEGTLQLGLEGGNVQYSLGEQIVQYCYNAEPTTLTIGQVVYISGSQGNKIAVKLADNSGDPSSAGTLGFVMETIASGGTGWVITEGNLRKINTLGLPNGALLYLGAAPGTYTVTPPTAPSHSVRLGYVERVSATVGSIYVKIDNGYELGELHDVVDTTTNSSYGDLLVKSGSVWTNSKQLTGSYGLTGSLSFLNGGLTGSLQGTASWAIQAQTASYADTFKVANNAVISGSLTILQNLTVFGSASITYITQSTLDIATNLITVNTDTPGVRFGGIAVADSGSSPRVSGSWLFDSIQDRWIFIHQSNIGSAVTSSIGIMGPETYNNLGNETQITLNRLTKGYPGDSGEHIGDSQVSDDGTTVSIPGNLTVTGSITGLINSASYALSASFASQAQNANTASYVLQAVSASFATSASYALSSSYALNATTASGLTGGTTNYVALWKTNTALSRSAFYQDPNNNNYVGLFTNLPTYSLDVLGTIRAQVDLRGESKVYFPNLSDGSPSTQVLIWEPTFGQLYRESASLLTVATASYVVNAVSASYVLQAVSASYAATSSYATVFNISSSLYSAGIRTAPGGTETAIITLTTGSYTAAFFDYTVSSGSNARAGTVMSVWNGASVQYTDNSTLDIGTTSDITLKVETGGANVQLVAATTTSPWSVKTTYRLI